MNLERRWKFNRAMESASAALIIGDHDAALHSFGKAHGLGQCHTTAHVRAHLGMARLAWQRRRGREVIDQLALAVAASLFTWTWREPDRARSM